ncbi:MAG: 2-dehydro-3-deoxygalactonokinase [Gammaproteobacteria bacterium]|jgi:2-dehydro-3-deoxygalactonokinase|nr:2-dehydro-3-deoxygalactonokinase [Gammaproteobacteria bacterium]
MSTLAWIAVDWGTSSLRIWGLDKDANTVFEATSNEGMASIACAADFETTLLSHIETCLTATDPVTVVCCGMVGAKQGWHDAGYQSLPINPLARQQVVRVPATDSRLQVWVVPGLCQRQPADVMRGEETQIAGVLAQMANQQAFSGMVCLPGTHSKWALCDAGEVTQFATFMTGEMFALLAKQSVLRFSVADSDWDAEIFKAAVKEAFAQPASISNLLFSVRATDVLGQAAGAFGKARLSGLLIGLELAGVLVLSEINQVHLVGGSELAELYQQACDALLIDTQVHSGETCVLAGLKAAYKQIVS